MKKHFGFFLLTIISAGIFTDRMVSAQAISIGVKGGVPLIDQSPYNDESKPYVVGPTIELRLPAGFAIEADALYQRIGNNTSFGTTLGINSGVAVFTTAASSFVNRVRGNEWEFPVLGKYYFRPGKTARPFVASGWALHTVGFHSDIAETVTDSNGTQHRDFFHGDSRSELGVGAVAAAGIQFHTGRVKWSPEMRYTRWGGTDSVLRKNEASFLLGISF